MMRSFTRLSHAAALALLLLAAILALRGYWPGRIDDWQYAGLLTWPQQLLWLSLGFAILPAACRWLAQRRRLFYLMVAVATCVVLAAVSIPSLLRSRMSAGGLSTGGAKGIDLFRASIEHGYLPRESDITYEGLFYDYLFETPAAEGQGDANPDAPSVFRPSFSWATLPDPLTKQDETFLAVGLRSDRETAHIVRPRLNLVVVLDISGSMGAPLSSYYYDAFGEPRQEREVKDEAQSLSKLELATRSIVAALDHLTPEDRLGIVLFDHRVYVAKPLRRVAATNIEAVKDHVLALTPRGGTNMEGGLAAGRGLFAGHEDEPAEEVENRILFLTDAMPNVGATDSSDLAQLAEAYARDRVHCTFLGIGVDFQSELVERLTKVRGANYYAVRSAADFEQRLAREFDYMVSPWAYDLTMRLEGGAYALAAVYGSPEADEASGELMHVRTLFPAPVDGQAVQGGILLLKLRPTGASGPLRLTAEYEDRSGRRYAATTEVAPAPARLFCASRAVRKAVLLARYARLMREWIREERGGAEREDVDLGFSPWERSSAPLHVSEGTKARVSSFREHFRLEAAQISDPALDREQSLLARLLGVKPAATTTRIVRNDPR